MTSHDVTDGCASAGRAPAPCEFCAAFFRLKKIKGRFWNPTSRGEEICLGLLRGVPPIATDLRDCSRVCCSLERMWTEGLRLPGRVTARRSGSLQTGWRCLRGHVQCAADPWHLVSGCRGWSYRACTIRIHTVETTLRLGPASPAQSKDCPSETARPSARPAQSHRLPTHGRGPTSCAEVSPDYNLSFVR
jgi:hypothetical protein